MRHTLTIISIFLTTIIYGQNSKERGSTYSWSDTTFILVKLRDTIMDNKIVAVDIGKKATIFVHLKSILAEVRKNLSSKFLKNNCNKIIRYLDSASLKSDTIFIREYFTLRDLEYFISNQLSYGNAKVFYKKQKSFVDTISHRLERYGGNADRFFYLPDRRPFFAVTEMRGILVRGEDLLNNGHFNAYIKEGEKLQSIRKE